MKQKISGGGAISQNSAALVQKKFADGLQHHQAGRLNEAKQLYQQVLDLEPRHADSLQLLGDIFHQTGSHAMAVELIGKAIAINSRVFWYHASLGNALQGQGRLDEAAASFRKAIKLNPDLAELHGSLGNVLRKKGLTDEAVASHRRAIALKPNLAEAHANLGFALQDQGRLDEAVESHRRATELKPDLAEAHSNLGLALQEQGRLDEAVASHRRATELKPDLAEAHANLGLALQEREQLSIVMSNQRKRRPPAPGGWDKVKALAKSLFRPATKQAFLPSGWQVYGAGAESQLPFDVAVIMPTIGRESILEAVASVYAQRNVNRIQLLIGVDRPLHSFDRLVRLLDAAPPHVVPVLFYPGYSTSVRHGGLHPSRDGGVLRSVLSYLANARYLSFLDDDNWWDEDHLAKLLLAIRGHRWAFTLRWFAHPGSRQPICVDKWESVGPARGVYQKKFGGFVDPNCLMFDKLECEPALRFWSIPLPGDKKAMTADRNVFHCLSQLGPPGETGDPTAFYVLDPDDNMHMFRLEKMGARYAMAAPSKEGLMQELEQG